MEVAMAPRRGPRPGGQQLEPVGEPGPDVGHAEQPDPPGRQFDGERQAVEFRADRRDVRGVVVVELEVRRAGRGPFDEQLDRVRGQQIHCVKRLRRLGQRQLAYPEQRFAGQLE